MDTTVPIYVEKYTFPATGEVLVRSWVNGEPREWIRKDVTR